MNRVFVRLHTRRRAGFASRCITTAMNADGNELGFGGAPLDTGS